LRSDVGGLSVSDKFQPSSNTETRVLQRQQQCSKFQKTTVKDV